MCALSFWHSVHRRLRKEPGWLAERGQDETSRASLDTIYFTLPPRESEQYRPLLFSKRTATDETAWASAKHTDSALARCCTPLRCPQCAYRSRSRCRAMQGLPNSQRRLNGVPYTDCAAIDSIGRTRTASCEPSTILSISFRVSVRVCWIEPNPSVALRSSFSVWPIKASKINAVGIFRRSRRMA